MADKAKFIDELSARYAPKGDFITLGKGMLDGEVVTDVSVTIPLKTINRHGLIAGATGTGKTKTLQVFAEQGAIVEPVAPPFPAEKLWFAWTTLRAMLNSNGKRAVYDDKAKRAQLKPETVWEIEQGQGLTAAAVYEASVIRSTWYAHAARLFDTYDALALPTAQVWPFPVEWRWPEAINGRVMDTYHRWMEVVIPVSLIGLPALSVPVGFGGIGVLSMMLSITALLRASIASMVSRMSSATRLSSASASRCAGEGEAAEDEAVGGGFGDGRNGTEVLGGYADIAVDIQLQCEHACQGAVTEVDDRELEVL